jgi:enoyl-CoA hydratase
MSIEATRDGRIGRLRMNRPQALNALDLGMIRALSVALDGWRDDPSVHAVVIEGEGRAFCAGGDIRAIRDAAVAGDAASIEAFFSEEYALNLKIATYPKPYVAVIDGICMGGGIGVSVHGTYRVASESALFAMPETSIALFPDVGTSYVLPRLPGSLGMYFGLTGARVSGADAVHAGFATHFVPKGAVGDLVVALARDGVAALSGFVAPLPGFSLSAHREAIDRCFSAGSLAGVLAALGDEGEWGAGVLGVLRGVSPSSLAWTFGLLRLGAERTLPECLAAELALTRRVTRHPDLVEGVRAMIIDKDRKPVWSPARVEEVDLAAIEAMLG